MSCSPYDLRDYLFEELGRDERRLVEQHVAACPVCQQELSALNSTQSLLRSIPEEEPSRRIAFVSDKVFEPRWWQRMWHSGPQLGFASACLLAAAIVTHGYLGPEAPAAVAQQPPAVIDQVRFEREIDRRVRAAIAEAETRHAAQLRQAVDTRVRQIEREHRSELMAVNDSWGDRVQKERALRERDSFYKRASSESIQ